MELMLTPEHIARAEILRIAEPEDPFTHLCLELLGPVKTADFFTGRCNLTREFWTSSETADVRERTSKTELEKIHSGLVDRINRWSPRAQKISPVQEFRMAETFQAWLCIPEDSDWPQQLNDLGEKKPFGIWGRGKRELLANLQLQQSVAVVGSRDISSYGQSVTSHLAGDLAQHGYSIISGGAFGIDAVAHRAALATSQSRLPTVALMACGVDRPYPKHNEDLLLEIIRSGLLLSEVSLGNSPTRWRFLQRNRLIAALSAYTIVVEARWRSGALNTANHALSIGRELGVVPGQIFSPNSEGCHRLLKKELAHLVTDAKDITAILTQRFSPVEQMLNIPSPAHKEPAGLTEIQKRVWDSLPLRKAAPIENLVAHCGLPERMIMMTLSQLAANGYAKNQENGWIKAQ